MAASNKFNKGPDNQRHLGEDRSVRPGRDRAGMSQTPTAIQVTDPDQVLPLPLGAGVEKMNTRSGQKELEAAEIGTTS